MFADPGVLNLIPARSHTLVEIGHEIFFLVILLLPLIQEGLVSVTRESMYTKYWLTASQACPGKSVVRLTDLLDMTIPVDWDVKPQSKQKL